MRESPLPKRVQRQFGVEEGEEDYLQHQCPPPSLVGCRGGLATTPAAFPSPREGWRGQQHQHPPLPWYIRGEAGAGERVCV